MSDKVNTGNNMEDKNLLKMQENLKENQVMKYLTG